MKDLTFKKIQYNPYGWELGNGVQLHRDYWLDRNFSRTLTIKRGSGAWYMTMGKKRQFVYGMEDVHELYKEWTGKELTDGKQE